MVVSALAATPVLTVMVRHRPKMFYLTLTAAPGIALSLVVFFLSTYPANRQTLNWTRLPDNWRELRQQWEYSPAAAAGLYVVAVIALSLSLLVERTE